MLWYRLLLLPSWTCAVECKQCDSFKNTTATAKIWEWVRNVLLTHWVIFKVAYYYREETSVSRRGNIPVLCQSQGLAGLLFGGHVKLLSESCSDSTERKLDSVQLKPRFSNWQSTKHVNRITLQGVFTWNCKELQCTVRDSTAGNETIKYWTQLQTERTSIAY
jgi:hypothetical protein